MTAELRPILAVKVTQFVRTKLQQMAKVLKSNGKDADEFVVYEHLVGLDQKHPSIAEYAEYITANYKSTQFSRRKKRPSIDS